VRVLLRDELISNNVMIQTVRDTINNV
jgi:hypothetical protein